MFVYNLCALKVDKIIEFKNCSLKFRANLFQIVSVILIQRTNCTKVNDIATTFHHDPSKIIRL